MRPTILSALDSLLDFNTRCLYCPVRASSALSSKGPFESSPLRELSSLVHWSAGRTQGSTPLRSGVRTTFCLHQGGLACHLGNPQVGAVRRPWGRGLSPYEGHPLQPPTSGYWARTSPPQRPCEPSCGLLYHNKSDSQHNFNALPFLPNPKKMSGQ